MQYQIVENKVEFKDLLAKQLFWYSNGLYFKTEKTYNWIEDSKLILNAINLSNMELVHFPPNSICRKVKETKNSKIEVEVM